eukprot:767160-Hanusia_phi.AAC.9
MMINTLLQQQGYTPQQQQHYMQQVEIGDRSFSVVNSQPRQLQTQQAQETQMLQQQMQQMQQVQQQNQMASRTCSPRITTDLLPPVVPSANCACQQQPASGTSSSLCRTP